MKNSSNNSKITSKSDTSSSSFGQSLNSQSLNGQSPINLSLRLYDSVSISDELIVGTYIERSVESEIKKFLIDPEVLVLRGPRQAGKTTLLKKLGQKLATKYGKDRVLLFNFEDDLIKKQFVDNPKAFVKYYLPQNKNTTQAKTQPLTFFLLDEVQYVKQAGKLLKLIYDVYPQVKLIVTGSSTLDINKLGQYLVGRAIFFEIYPFSFAEFLKAKDHKLEREYRTHQFNFSQPQKQSTNFIQALNDALNEYLTYGGYPRIVLEKDKNKKQILLRNLYNTYVEKDVAGLFGSKYKNNLLDIVKYLAVTIGQLVQYQDICNTVGVTLEPLKQTLAILEQTYLIKQIKPFYKNQVTELKKNPKFYFMDPGMRNVLLAQFNKFSSAEYGHLLENYVLLRLLHQKYQPKYWRTTAKAEIEFVLPKSQMPLEVKKQAKITRALRSFIKTYQPKTAVVTDLEKAGMEVINKTTVYTVPIGLI